MFARVLMEPRRMRLNSLDTWRGLVIFLMMLDHVRDFFNRGALTSTPTEAGHTTVLLYLTRWITHLCAPTFLFLAGAGIRLQYEKNPVGCPPWRQYFHEARTLLCAFGSRTADSSSGPLVEKHVKRYDPAVPHDDEIPPGVSRHFTRASRYPWNHPCIAIFLRSGSHLISKVRMSRLDRARDAIDLVAATNSALAGIVEHSIFGPEFVDGRAPTRGIVFTKHVA